MQERFTFLNRTFASNALGGVTVASSNDFINTNENELDWLFKIVNETFDLQGNNRNTPRVLFMDSTLPLLALGDPKVSSRGVQGFVNFLESHNIALVITVSTKFDEPIYDVSGSELQHKEEERLKFSLKTLKNRLRFDSELLLGVSKMKGASQSVIPVRIVKGFRLPQGTREKFTLELSILEESVQWSLDVQKNVILEKLKLIYQYKNQKTPLTGAQIAMKLNIKESLVKKHVVQLQKRLAIRDSQKKQYFVVGVGDEGELIPVYLQNYKPPKKKSESDV